MNDDIETRFNLLSDELFIVKDFTGIEQFTELKYMTIAFVGDIENYQFESIKLFDNIRLSLNYEPIILSDHSTGGSGMQYKYVYVEELEQGIITYVNEF